MNSYLVSFRLIGLSIAVCVVAYTALILATASVVAPEKRLGSLFYGSDGQVIVHGVVAQPFTRRSILGPDHRRRLQCVSGGGAATCRPPIPRFASARRNTRKLTPYKTVLRYLLIGDCLWFGTRPAHQPCGRTESSRSDSHESTS